MVMSTIVEAAVPFGVLNAPRGAAAATASTYMVMTPKKPMTKMNLANECLVGMRSGYEGMKEEMACEGALFVKALATTAVIAASLSWTAEVRRVDLSRCDLPQRELLPLAVLMLHYGILFVNI